MNVALWIVQVLLAALFVFAGAMKFIMPVEEMTKQMPSMPGAFLHFIGLCELLGGLGLILPALFRVAVGLVPLAAAGLVVIMIGATVISLKIGPAAGALIPLVVGLLAAFVAWGRSRAVPHRARGAVDSLAGRSTR